ncbi:unnamed protein product [Closterium sp. NIES-54]
MVVSERDSSAAGKQRAPYKGKEVEQYKLVCLLRLATHPAAAAATFPLQPLRPFCIIRLFRNLSPLRPLPPLRPLHPLRPVTSLQALLDGFKALPAMPTLLLFSPPLLFLIVCIPIFVLFFFSFTHAYNPPPLSPLFLVNLPSLLCLPSLLPPLAFPNPLSLPYFPYPLSLLSCF